MTQRQFLITEMHMTSSIWWFSIACLNMYYIWRGFCCFVFCLNVSSMYILHRVDVIKPPSKYWCPTCRNCYIYFFITEFHINTSKILRSYWQQKLKNKFWVQRVKEKKQESECKITNSKTVLLLYIFYILALVI